MNLRIGVVGSGAIGSYYGGKLAAAGEDVHFLMRGDLAEIRAHGLHLTGEGEDLIVHPIQCHNSTNDMGPCDLVLIAIKTIANSVLPKLLPPLLHEGTLLLTLQNGLGNEELLAEHFGGERVLGGLCFICLTRTSRTTIERADAGHVSIGEFNRAPLARTRELADRFERSGLSCNVVENLALERWRKLVWNIPFNGLSILAGEIDTASILRDEQLHETTLAVMKEVIEAANLCGLPLHTSSAAEQIERTKTMGTYQPSTLVDFQAGRPLEIEAIWGEPLRRARAAGAETPRLQMLYSLLRSLDRARQDAAAAVPQWLDSAV
jgi:2-dehydropantoate 2-reductase